MNPLRALLALRAICFGFSIGLISNRIAAPTPAPALPIAIFHLISDCLETMAAKLIKIRQ